MSNKICNKLLYLIGAPEQFIDNYEDYRGVFVYLRKLCTLRNDIIEKTPALHELRRNGDTVTAISETSTLIKRMSECGYNMDETLSLYQCVIMLNEQIDKVVNNAVFNIPEIPTAWITELFHMPNGDTTEGVKIAVRKYHKWRNYHPYQKWINWDFAATAEEKRSKNILRDDDIFIELNSEMHANKSHALIDFAEQHDSLTVVVDCENSDAQRLYNSLRIIQKKLHKVILVNDAHTNALWNELENDFVADGINTEHIKITRLKKEKSLADCTLTAKICEAYYRDNLHNFVLASSDSDMWSIIAVLHDANFMVLAEKCKCGDVLIDALTQNKVPYCFMEDVQTDSTDLMDRLVHQEVEIMAQKRLLSARRLVLNVVSKLNVYPPDEILNRYISEALPFAAAINE